MEIGLVHYLVLSAILFSLGIFTVLSRRHVIVMLMGTELILNAAALNFVAFGRYVSGGLDGQLMSLFVIVLAAAEAAIALAIVLYFYNNHGTVDVDRADELRG